MLYILMENLDTEGNDDDVDLLDKYIPLVHFLGEAMGKNTEIVLHDLAVPDESIIAIANGHISGRELGGPVTNFALWFMKQGTQAQATSMSGYRAVNSEGRICRSSSYFIRDSHGELRGMLCINVDVTDAIRAQEAIGHLVQSVSISSKPTPDGINVNTTEMAAAFDAAAATAALSSSTEPAPLDATTVGQIMEKMTSTTMPAPATASDEHPVVLEDLRSNLENMLTSMLDAAIAKQDISPDRMMVNERVQVIADLDEAGFFLLKGGIAAAADRLQVSEPTVYRYLVKARGA